MKRLVILPLLCWPLSAITWLSQYHLDAGSPVSLVDALGAHNIASNAGCTSVAGILNGAAGCANTAGRVPAQYFNVGANFLTGAQFTLEAAIYITSLPAVNYQASVIAAGYDGSVVPWMLWIDPAAHLRCGSNSGGVWTSAVSTATIPLTTWTDVACTYNAGAWTLYINGAADGTLSLTKFGTTGSTMLIGGDWVAGANHAFNGRIDEVRLSNAAATAAEILASYNSIAPVCLITTSSLPPGTVGTAYSQNIATATCSLPTFSVSAGSLPTGLSLNTSTGLISGTPSTITGSPFAFTILATDANGNPTQAYSVGVSVVGTPVITAGPTCTANSPSSAKCAWTTDILSSSRIQCGTVSGGPYTAYQTTEVYLKGVTAHSMVIPGLPNNVSGTAYWCVVLSRQVGGATATSGPVSTGTLAAMVSTPFTAILSPVTRYNDQYNGDRGMPNLGIAANMDTYYPTMWADDGKLYGSANDTAGLASAHGSYTGAGSNIAIYRTSPANGTPTAATASLLTMSIVNRLGNFGNSVNTCSNGTTVGVACWTDGATWKSGNGIAFNGKLVLHVMRQGGAGGVWANSSQIISSDHGATWLAPANYPGGAPQANGDPPAGPATAMWTGAGAGNICGGAAIPQHGQDYGFTGSSFVNYGNADAYVYVVCTRGDTGTNSSTAYLARVRVEDFLLFDVTKYQYYSGGDGLLDVNWTSSAAGAVPIGAGSTGAGNGGCAFGVEFIPDFNRWMFTCYASSGSTVITTALILDAPYPWGPTFTLAGALPRVQTALNYVPGFTAPLASTYSKLSSNPLVSSIVVVAGGTFNGSFTASPAIDEYSPHWFTARLVPAVVTPKRSLVGNGRNQHISTGLDLFYNFQGGSGSSGTSLIGARGSTFSYTVPDLSPNGKYSIALAASTPALFDQDGMINFGLWSGFVVNCTPACDAPLAYKLTSPYNVALTDFTLILQFEHYPSSLANVTTETVLDATGLQIQRNGSTANSWTVTVGTHTTAAFALPTDVAMGSPITAPALVVRRTSGIVNVYSSSGVGALPPLTSLATATDSTALGPLFVGSKADGSLGFRGIVGELLIYHRALSDLELSHEMGVVRWDLAQRGVTIP